MNDFQHASTDPTVCKYIKGSPFEYNKISNHSFTRHLVNVYRIYLQNICPRYLIVIYSLVEVDLHLACGRSIDFVLKFDSEFCVFHVFGSTLQLLYSHLLSTSSVFFLRVLHVKRVYTQDLAEQEGRISTAR